ncbi:glycosyltransferase family 2 protein [Salisaeta longa]|uniref:glycosyltransferase family 2 protein n=1 Tax=Salisaeta longa TaxID=503170 RepID=UPI0003B75253|nr:glycosyltransferase family 2 protein [Salisaeta longa]
MHEAIVICTRNRPAELRITLRSIRHALGAHRTLWVIDASDAAQAKATAACCEGPSMHYRRYAKPPSTAAQRNAGVDALPPSVGCLHFVDDDVTVRPGLADALRAHPSWGGVGGRVVEAHAHTPGATALRRLFLLDHPRPGRVLASGHTSYPEPAPPGPTPVEWLPGCACSYRRAVFDAFRFDERLRGYAMLEDLDFSFRVGQLHPLRAVPGAVLEHRRTPTARFDRARYTERALIHRWWFVRKHFAAWERLAYAWAALGEGLALWRAGDRARCRGWQRGLRAVCAGRDPLL